MFKKSKKRKHGVVREAQPSTSLPKKTAVLTSKPIYSTTSAPSPAAYNINLADDSDSDTDIPAPLPAPSLSNFAPSKTSTLTPLQQTARAKLTGSRFRSLNETLYTTPSCEAFKQFQADPTLFDDYHAGEKTCACVVRVGSQMVLLQTLEMGLEFHWRRLL